MWTGASDKEQRWTKGGPRWEDGDIVGAGRANRCEHERWVVVALTTPRRPGRLPMCAFALTCRFRPFVSPILRQHTMPHHASTQRIVCAACRLSAFVLRGRPREARTDGRDGRCRRDTSRGRAGGRGDPCVAQQPVGGGPALRRRRGWVAVARRPRCAIARDGEDDRRGGRGARWCRDHWQCLPLGHRPAGVRVQGGK